MLETTHADVLVFTYGGTDGRWCTRVRGRGAPQAGGDDDMFSELE